MKKVDYKLDTLRVISMFLVIVVHVANYYCRAFDDISNASYMIEIVFNAIGRVAVPIFFMISGALLLNQKYDSKKNNKKIIKYIIVLAVFTIIYALWDKFYMGKTIGSIIDIIKYPDRAMLWFMYAMIAIQIALPFIKCMVDGMDEKLEKQFVILWLTFNGGVFLLKKFINLSIQYLIPIVSGTYYLGYFVVGYIIYKNREKIMKNKNNLLYILSFAISILVIVIISYYQSEALGKCYDSFLAYQNLFVIFASLAFYLMVYFNISEKENNLITFIAKNSFGVYLIHGIFLDIFMKLVPYKEIISFLVVPVAIISIGIVSILAVYLLKKIPIIKNYI